MNQNWHEIWNKRALADGKSILEQLIKADGFDSGAGAISVQQWQAYVSWIKEKLNVQSQNTLYEIGCGSGAFLYQFYKAGHQVGGLDYSSPLINIAQNIMPEMKFKCLPAIQMQTKPQYDIVVSNSMFHYLPTLTDAEKIVEKMLDKAKIKIAILDINDIQYKNRAQKIRQGALAKDEYTRKYHGLHYLFFDHSFFIKLAKRHQYNIDIFKQNIDGYQNNPFRFNVIIEK